MPRRDPLRVHVAGVGAREVDRVCGPLFELRADRVVLLRRAVDDAEAMQRDRIREVLTAEHIEVAELDVVMEEPALIGHTVAGIVEREPLMVYRFNLSTGPREAALGGHLASMFWRIQPYFSHVDETVRARDPEFNDHPFSHVTDVPAFRRDPPRGELLDALHWLVRHGKPARQKDWIDALEGAGIIKAKGGRGRSELTEQAKQGQFRSIAEGLLEMGVVERESPTGPRRWQPTDQAYTVLALFRGYRLGTR